MKQFLFPPYIFTFLLFAIFSYLFVDPNLSYMHFLYTGFPFIHRDLATYFYVGFIIILFVLFGAFVLHEFANVPNDKKLKQLILLLSFILLFAYPAMLSYDIFNYIATAKVLFHYHENPYLIMPIAFRGDPLLAFMHAPNKTALYGPVWILLTGIPYLLGIGNFLLQMYFFKLFSTLFFLLIIFVLTKMVKEKKDVMLFALNPLVLIELVGHAHNDSVMLCFLILSFYLLQKKRFLFSVFCFSSSVFIKFATIVLLPVFLFLLYKYIKKQSINWEKIYLVSGWLMVGIFMLSFLREEIYPWYSTWFLVFLPFVAKQKFLVGLATVLSFGLMLRYVPYMYSARYFGLTPVIRILVTTIPVLLYLLIWIVRKTARSYK